MLSRNTLIFDLRPRPALQAVLQAPLERRSKKIRKGRQAALSNEMGVRDWLERELLLECRNIAARKNEYEPNEGRED